VKCMVFIKKMPIINRIEGYCKEEKRLDPRRI